MVGGELDDSVAACTSFAKRIPNLNLKLVQQGQLFCTNNFG